MRPAEDIARGIKATVWRKFLPPPSKMVLVSIPSRSGIGPLIKRIVDVIGGLELLSWNWDNEISRGVGRAGQNVWGRAWRRRKLQAQPEGGSATSLGHEAAGSETCQLGFAVTVQVEKSEATASLHWLEGHDQSIFESLGGFLQRKLEDIGTN